MEVDDDALIEERQDFEHDARHVAADLDRMRGVHEQEVSGAERPECLVGNLLGAQRRDQGVLRQPVGAIWIVGMEHLRHVGAGSRSRASRMISVE